MTCSYCQENNKLTREHLIPMSLIDMFPECEYNIIHDEEVRCFKSEQIVIKDVCERCNNENLSKLDTYGSNLVREYFLNNYEADDTLDFQHNHSMLSRWLLKILFNIARSHKSKIDTTWFESNSEYILGKIDQSVMPFSVFGGLSVDMTPLPEFMTDNVKLGIYFNPILVEGSLFEFADPIGTKIKLNKEYEPLKFNKIVLTAILRFGSGLFYVILWDNQIDSEERENIEKVIQRLYPYNLLYEDEKSVLLERVTHAYNYHHYYIIDSNLGLSIADSTNCMLPKNKNPIQIRTDNSENWNKYVENIRENRATRRQKEREKRKKSKNK